MFEDLHKNCGDDICNTLGDIEEEGRDSFHFPPLQGTGAIQNDNCCGAALLDVWAARHGLVISLVGLV